ncbi:MAG TPA: VTT domain-containing protein [Opitutaceae bacterium]|nr:VTT domain-containing protein [Opitutaceae bacterium]
MPLAIGLVVVAVVVFFVARGLDYHGLQERAVTTVRGLGPWAFFSAMAILPAFSVPLSLFTLTAGELYAPLMTLPGVIAAAFVAIGINMVITYWLARYALRPVLSRLVARYGYTIPKVTKANALSVTLALRLTPGPPFFIQSYLLGMAEVPFRLYLVASLLCQIPWGVGSIVLGKGIFNGNFKMVMYGIGVLVVAGIAVQWFRRKGATRAS